MDYSKMSKAEIFRLYGPFIKDNFGKEELAALRREPVDVVRKYVIDLDPEPVNKNKGGLLSKKYMNPVKVVDNLKPKLSPAVLKAITYENKKGSVTISNAPLAPESIKANKKRIRKS
tara:strand:+ start:141 stop:491 length:351 start_codon:yes stop_codon:yes gene_type:complete